MLTISYNATKPVLRGRPIGIDRSQRAIEVFGCAGPDRAEDRRGVRGKFRPSETTQRRKASAELLPLCILFGLQSLQHGLHRHRHARLAASLGRCLRTSIKGSLDATESSGDSYGRFDGVGMGFALVEYGLCLGSKVPSRSDVRGAWVRQGRLRPKLCQAVLRGPASGVRLGVTLAPGQDKRVSASRR